MSEPVTDPAVLMAIQIAFNATVYDAGCLAERQRLGLEPPPVVCQRQLDVWLHVQSQPSAPRSVPLPTDPAPERSVPEPRRARRA